MSLQQADLDTEGQSSTERCNDTNNPIQDLSISPLRTAGDPIIAVDLDDVLSETNIAVSKCEDRTIPAIDDLLIATGHNDNYGSPGEMNLSNFYYYYYWKVGILYYCQSRLKEGVPVESLLGDTRGYPSQSTRILPNRLGYAGTSYSRGKGWRGSSAPTRLPPRHCDSAEQERRTC